jgi:hypothetical protein
VQAVGEHVDINTDACTWGMLLTARQQLEGTGWVPSQSSRLTSFIPYPEGGPLAGSSPKSDPRDCAESSRSAIVSRGAVSCMLVLCLVSAGLWDSCPYHALF